MKGVRLWEQLKTQARATPWWALKVSLALSPSNYHSKESKSLFFVTVKFCSLKCLPVITYPNTLHTGLPFKKSGEWVNIGAHFFYFSLPSNPDWSYSHEIEMSSQPGPHESQGLVALPLLWKDVSKLVESLCLRHFCGGDAPLIVWVDLLVQILGPLSGMFLRAPRWANRLHRPAFPLPN